MNLLKGIRVENMQSTAGNDVPNQFIIRTTDGTIFQSYDSIIAVRKRNGDIILDEACWDYSVTTGKYRNIFLREKKPETEKKIKAGVYKLEDLNS